jgi:hypothetical protein
MEYERSAIFDALLIKYDKNRHLFARDVWLVSYMA